MKIHFLTDSNNSQSFSSLGFVLSVIGYAYLAWFFLSPILSGKVAEFELLGISLIIIEMMALVCDGSIMAARDATVKFPDKASRFDQYWRSAVGIIMSLFFVAAISFGLHNYLYLWVFFVSLISKLLMHFFVKIDYNFRETVWQTAILTATAFVAVFAFTYFIPVWGLVYYSVILARSFYQLEKASTPGLKAVIFDQDGVIADTEKVNVASALYAFGQLGVSLTEEDKKMFVGVHPEDYKNTLIAKYNLVFDKYLALRHEYYSRELENAQIFTKTVAIIRTLHDLKIPLGLVTSSRRLPTEKMLAKIGLTDVFSAIVCFEDTPKRKPAPDCYLICASKLGFDSSECLAVEDSFTGLTAAKAAGATCFVIPNDATRNQDFSQADRVIDYVGELEFKLFDEVIS